MMCADTKGSVWHYVGTTRGRSRAYRLHLHLYNSTEFINFPCAGKAGCSPLNLYARVRHSTLPIAHETAGAARTRSSLRPLVFRGRTSAASLRAPRAARIRMHALLTYLYRPSLRAQRSNPTFFLLRDGLLRYARNDADRAWIMRAWIVDGARCLFVMATAIAVIATKQSIFLFAACFRLRSQ